MNGEVWIGGRTPEQLGAFQDELKVLLNIHNMDTFTGTPDHILAEIMVWQLTNVRHHRLRLAEWEGRPIRTIGPIDV